mmetsp:Transcript_21456/g.52937  ORF Transcript_21456/g.52937 Transcript_21456/m.52937 type:complete len:263 (+) Transcript_21456:452-1240(+)
MRAQLVLLRVEGGDEKRLARVPHRDALALHIHPPLGHDREEDVGELRVEQVDVVDVQHATVSLSEEARLEHSLALAHTLLDVDGAEQAVVEHVERHLHEGALDDLGLEVRQLLTLLVELCHQEVVYVARGRVDVVGGTLHYLDGREQPVERLGHDRLAGAAPARDHDAAHGGVDGGEEERCLDRLLPHDEREGEGPALLRLLDALGRVRVHRVHGRLSALVKVLLLSGVGRNHVHAESLPARPQAERGRHAAAEGLHKAPPP